MLMARKRPTMRTSITMSIQGLEPRPRQPVAAASEEAEEAVPVPASVPAQEMRLARKVR